MTLDPVVRDQGHRWLVSGYHHVAAVETSDDLEIDQLSCFPFPERLSLTLSTDQGDSPKKTSPSLLRPIYSLQLFQHLVMWKRRCIHPQPHLQGQPAYPSDIREQTHVSKERPSSG